MSRDGGCLLIDCYRDLRNLADLKPVQWDRLVRQGRRAGLLGRLHALAEDARLLDVIPPGPQNHLHSARIEAERINSAACWEIGQIAGALEPFGIPIVALKGGAYALADSPVATGRRFSDVDILVPKAAIRDVERRLNAQGWVSTHMDAYDQRYYREWMHEIPPMQHVTRKTSLDIHHGILPETVAQRPDPRLLLQDAIAVEEEGLENVYVLSPVDRWLHSATHLFQEGEFDNALRDLTDLDLLSRELGAEPGFWDALVDRAGRLNLTLQLFYATWFLERVLATPMPEGYVQDLARFGPNAPMRAMMDALYRQAFRSLHDSCDTTWGGIGRWMLYIRSHAIRMPPHLLLPHLAHKALIVPYQEWREGQREKKATV